MEYNVEFKQRERKQKYDVERNAINEFLASDNENICFTYINNKKAYNAYQSMWNYARSYKKPIRIKLREDKLIVVRK